MAQPQHNMLAEHFGLPSPTASPTAIGEASAGMAPLQRRFTVSNMVPSPLYAVLEDV